MLGLDAMQFLFLGIQQLLLLFSVEITHCRETFPFLHFLRVRQVVISSLKASTGRLLTGFSSNTSVALCSLRF
jgi:hypothetical protein